MTSGPSMLSHYIHCVLGIMSLFRIRQVTIPRDGVVASCEGFDQYIVIIDGSRRLTRRNRKFLRRFEPFDPSGVSHRGKDQVVVSRKTDNTGQRLTEENPSRVLPVYPRVEETIDRSPSRALVRTETREETMPEIDRSSFGESIEPEIREVPVTESTGPVVSPPRRSTRSNKGQTNRFKDYETNF